MSWPCPVCQKDFSRKDNLQRHMNSKHSDSSFAPVIPMSQEKCHRFQLVHPFTCMVAGMTGSGKTVWVQSLLQQTQTVIDQLPERIIWCYSQWQPAYSQLLMLIPTIEFLKGIPTALEQDAYLDVNKRNLIVIDDQMIKAGKDNQIASPKSERYLHCAKFVSSRQRQPKHQLKHALLGVVQESSG